ncbi:hypothetical protein FB567DRAFT_105337 [Paraphoma chrysanthemicola]|uniref:DUF7730 domain-containing protein n=1 Tax=Paraphoma chrysanthemicola TaxID=798071 RepID=A0A8K0VW47_9PLEO|nr:hypothetical protein FB567DRAFT_105337 [Paraphoma chrysanthemicola]
MTDRTAPAARWCHFNCLQSLESRLRRGRRSSKSRQEPVSEPLSVSEPLRRPPTFRVGTKCSQTQSALLGMPAEIRNLIWEYVVASDPVILYQKTGRITYDYLIGEGPEVVHNISPQTLTHIERTHSISENHTTKKIRLLAVLQTCQMIYFETIEHIYKANTFVVLHNAVFKSICGAMLPSRLALIRSIHLHHRFRELEMVALACGDGIRDHFPPPTDHYTFARLLSTVCGRLPSLENLSVFLQGPLMRRETLTWVLNRLKEARRELESLKYMVVRFPRLIADVTVRPEWERFENMGIKDALRRAQDEFHIVQPPVAPGLSEYDMADVDTGPGIGWKVGSLYTGIDKRSGTIESRNYAVLLQGAEEGEGALSAVGPF